MIAMETFAVVRRRSIDPKILDFRQSACMLVAKEGRQGWQMLKINRRMDLNGD